MSDIQDSEAGRLINEYRQLVERLEGVWVWSEYDLEHDQGFRREICGMILAPELESDLEELDKLYLAATKECPRWRKYVQKPDPAEFWWRFPVRVDSYWDDFFERNNL